MNARGFALALGLVVGAAILAGLLTVGGPLTARHEAYDRQRLADLTTIARSLASAETLPEALTIESLGPLGEARGLTPDALAALLVDPETGDAYRYAREADLRFSVCATFHDALWLEAGMFGRESSDDLVLDREAGCVRGRLGLAPP
jgi:hypothetical protein